MADQLQTPFFLVWSPTGETPPRKRWPNQMEAEREAERMANRFPGKDFYVVAPTYRVGIGVTVRERFGDDDDMVPF